MEARKNTYHTVPLPNEIGVLMRRLSSEEGTNLVRKKGKTMGLFSKKKNTTASGAKRCSICGGKVTYENYTDDVYVDCKVCGTEMKVPGKTCLCENCFIYHIPSSSTITCPKCGQTFNLPGVMTMGGIRESH